MAASSEADALEAAIRRIVPKIEMVFTRPLELLNNGRASTITFIACFGVLLILQAAVLWTSLSDRSKRWFIKSVSRPKGYTILYTNPIMVQAIFMMLAVLCWMVHMFGMLMPPVHGTKLLPLASMILALVASNATRATLLIGILETWRLYSAAYAIERSFFHDYDRTIYIAGYTPIVLAIPCAIFGSYGVSRAIFTNTANMVLCVCRVKIGIASSSLDQMLSLLMPVRDLGLASSGISLETATEHLDRLSQAIVDIRMWIKFTAIVFLVWHMAANILICPLLHITLLKLRRLLSKPVYTTTPTSTRTDAEAASAGTRPEVLAQLFFYQVVSVFNLAYALGLFFLIIPSITNNENVSLKFNHYGFPILSLVTTLPLLVFQLVTSYRQHKRARQRKPLAIPFNVVLTTENAVREDVDLDYDYHKDKRCLGAVPVVHVSLASVPVIYEEDEKGIQ